MDALWWSWTPEVFTVGGLTPKQSPRSFQLFTILHSAMTIFSSDIFCSSAFGSSSKASKSIGHGGKTNDNVTQPMLFKQVIFLHALKHIWMIHWRCLLLILAQATHRPYTCTASDQKSNPFTPASSRHRLDQGYCSRSFSTRTLDPTDDPLYFFSIRATLSSS